MKPLVSIAATAALCKNRVFNMASAQSILALGILACVSHPVFAMPSVSGNRITWNEDGWYQVQRMSTFESLCEGGSFCVVDDGAYIVINHTTGQRYENVIVSGGGSVNEAGGDIAASDGSGNSVVSVVDQLISWSSDDYFQVQNATTFQSICEGTSNCRVEPGVYNVINLSLIHI